MPLQMMDVALWYVVLFIGILLSFIEDKGNDGNDQPKITRKKK